MNTEIAGHATPATLYQQEHPNLADNGFTYIQNSVWLDTNSDSDFSASLMIANFILQAASHDPSIMSRIVEQTLDVSSYTTIHIVRQLMKAEVFVIETKHDCSSVERSFASGFDGSDRSLDQLDIQAASCVFYSAPKRVKRISPVWNEYPGVSYCRYRPCLYCNQVVAHRGAETRVKRGRRFRHFVCCLERTVATIREPGQFIREGSASRSLNCEFLLV